MEKLGIATMPISSKLVYRIKAILMQISTGIPGGLGKLNAKFIRKCGQLRPAKELLEEEEEMVATASSLADAKAEQY